jgi:hypothetical protein
MEHEAPTPAPPVAAPPVVVAAPDAVGGAPLGVDQVLSLQRSAGNRAVCRAIASGLIQRDDAQPAGGGGSFSLSVSPQKATFPLESGVTIAARVDPAGTGAQFSLAAGTASPAAGTSIDASTGVVTLDAKQPGGTLKAQATPPGGTPATAEFAVIEKPTGIASTNGGSSGNPYQGSFTHTFTTASGNPAGLNKGNVNEKFPTPTVTSPFKAGSFTVDANKAGSHGWDLDGSGAMTGTDDVEMKSKDVDAGDFIASASNPKPKGTLPAGFSMDQEFHNKSFPSGSLEATAFTTTQHVRTLDERNGKLVFVIKSGTKEVEIPYAGPAVYRNAKADTPTVEASGPKPAKGDWKRNEVQVSVSAEGSGASASYSIVGPDLGCEVNLNGKVKVGSQAGTITVRAGDKTRYDEVKITITPAPSPKTGAPAPTDAGDAAPVPEAVGAPDQLGITAVRAS